MGLQVPVFQNILITDKDSYDLVRRRLFNARQHEEALDDSGTHRNKDGFESNATIRLRPRRL
jgi:hypothetical protein